MHRLLMIAKDFLRSNMLGMYYDEEGKRHLEYNTKRN